METIRQNLNNARIDLLNAQKSLAFVRRTETDPAVIQFSVVHFCHMLDRVADLQSMAGINQSFC